MENFRNAEVKSIEITEDLGSMYRVRSISLSNVKGKGKLYEEKFRAIAEEVNELKDKIDNMS